MNYPDTGRETYHHGNHPIKWVRVTGVIVAVDEFSARRVYTIDDSSGMSIECTCPAPPPAALPVPTHLAQVTVTKEARTSTVQNRNSAPEKPASSTPSVETPLVPWDDIDVGSVVKIKGKPGAFRDVFQVNIIKLEVIRSTEQEVRCWNEVLAFRKEVLRVPWVVSQEAEDRFRKRAEREKQYKNSSRRYGKSKTDKSKGKREEREKNVERRKGDESGDGRENERREGKKRKLERDEGLHPENKVNYPSLAVRRKLAGKYDALGI